MAFWIQAEINFFILSMFIYLFKILLKALSVFHLRKGLVVQPRLQEHSGTAKRKNRKTIDAVHQCNEHEKRQPEILFFFTFLQQCE